MCYIFFYLLTINCNLIKRQDEKERERRGKEGEREKVLTLIHYPNGIKTGTGQSWRQEFNESSKVGNRKPANMSWWSVVASQDQLAPGLECRHSRMECKHPSQCFGSCGQWPSSHELSEDPAYLINYSATMPLKMRWKRVSLYTIWLITLEKVILRGRETTEKCMHKDYQMSTQQEGINLQAKRNLREKKKKVKLPEHLISEF